ncbi:MAG: diguanylate cyclase [Synergistaceae bacterium]|nr:diguanylate cyclase [Synergistaceae bacterium]
MAITEENSSKKIKSAAVIAALVFILSALIFMNMTYTNARKEIFASMHDLERQNVLMLRQNLEINRNFVSSISINLGRMTEDLNSAEAIKYIREQDWFADFGALYLIKRDGNMYFGNMNSDSERNYYKDLMSKNSIYSDVKAFNSEAGNYLTINSPVRHNDEIIGGLSARFYRDKLNELVTFDIFNGTGYCYLLSKDGSIIARSDHPIANKKANTLKELFLSVPGGADGKIYYTAIADGMENGKSGEMIYPIKRGNRAVSYMPIGVADMYLVTSVPEDVAFSAAYGRFFNGIAFVLVSIITFASLMYYFFAVMKSNSEIIEIANRELSLIYESMPGGIVRYVRKGGKLSIKSANERFYRLIGKTKEIFEKEYDNNLINILSAPLFEETKQDIELKVENEEAFETELKLDMGDGSVRWVCLSVDYVNWEDGTREIVGIISDITDIKLADQELYVSKEQFDIVKKLTNVIFFEWDIETGTFSHSSNFLDFFDPLDSYENFPYSIEGYGAFSLEDAKEMIALFEQLKAGLKKSSAEFRIVNKFGDLLWYKSLMSTILDESGKPVKVVGILTDIDEQKRKLQSAEEIAMKDPLTQLYNKTSTRDLIESYIGSTQSQGVFMMLDIDNFKRVNDTLGHLYGDAVLSELAHTLKSLFRDSDITGRIGGDEFVVFMTNVKETAVARKKAERILNAFKRSFRKEGVEYGISCSIGISLYPWNGTTYEKLLQKADLSLYFSKSSGKNQYNFYSDSMDINDLSGNNETREPTEINAIYGLVQKNFRENVAEYILKLFYQYEDVDVAVPILLDFVGKSFDLGRVDVSVFSEDDTYYEVLYEWCDEGVDALNVDGRRFAADEWSSIKSHLDENDILLCSDVEIGFPGFLENDDMRDRGVKSIMLRYIVEHEKRKAVLSFEHYKEKHVFTKEEMDTIRTISDTISLFVLRARERVQYDEKEAQMRNWEVMLDETDDIVYVSDAESYELLYLNRTGRDQPWLQGKDFKNHRCYEFLFGSDQPCSFCTMHLLSKDKYYVWERTDPNSGYYYMLKDKLLDWNGRLARIEWGINLTEKQKMQKMLSSRLKIEKALLAGVGEMAYASDLEESMNVILKCVADLYKADRSYMMRINEDGHTISMTNEWLAEGVAPEIGNLQNFPLDKSPLWHKAFTKQEPVFLADISEFRETDPDEYERLAVQGIVDMYAIPITIKGRFWGFVGVDTPRKYKGDMYVLESVAYFVADEISKRNIIEMGKRKVSKEK